MIKESGINITKAAFPAPFESGLEYNPPTRGVWNIVHTGMLIPESRQIFVCAQGCLTGKVNLAGRDYAAETAALIRKVYFADGDYETAGWAKHQISEITL